MVQQFDQKCDILICECDTFASRTAEQCPRWSWRARAFPTVEFCTDACPDVDDTVGTRTSSDGLSGKGPIAAFTIVAHVVIHSIAAEANLVLVTISAP